MLRCQDMIRLSLLDKVGKLNATNEMLLVHLL
jgi:hypothetical protein